MLLGAGLRRGADTSPRDGGNEPRNGHSLGKSLAFAQRARKNRSRQSRESNLPTGCHPDSEELGRGRHPVPEKLMPLVYEELRRLARKYLSHERSDHTLQATALVHESYLRLVDDTRMSWKDRAHFYGAAASSMRRILVDYARAHNAEKRGGKLEKIYLDETKELLQESPPDLVALDDALQNFAATFPRESLVVEMNSLAGWKRKRSPKCWMCRPRPFHATGTSRKSGSAAN